MISAICIIVDFFFAGFPWIFIWNLNMARKKNPKVNVLLLGTGVCTPDAQNGLHYHGSEDLQEVLNSALWWNWPKCRLQKNRGHVVELATWEGDWQATPTVGMSEISSDEERTESATYIEFVQQHAASDGKTNISTRYTALVSEKPLGLAFNL